MADEQEEILETDDVNMDHRKMRQTHELAGYREGLESGKEAHLQQGFNEGFTHGCVVSREWGRLRGALSELESTKDNTSLWSEQNLNAGSQNWFPNHSTKL